MRKHGFIHRIFTATTCALLFCFAFLFTAQPVKAQDEGEQIEQGFKKLSSEEEAKLRAILAEPAQKDAPVDKLNSQIARKLHAAEQLGDPNLRLNVFREGVELVPNSSTYRNNLALELLNRGEIAEGNKWRQEAINTAANDFSRAFQISNFAWDLYTQNKDAEAWAAIEQSERLLKTLTPKQPTQHLQMARTNRNLNTLKSNLFGRKGQDQAAINAINTALNYSREAVKLLTPNTNALDKLYTYGDLAKTLSRKLHVLMEAKKLNLAETALQEYLRLFQDVNLTPDAQAFAYTNAARLRFNQREFVQEEKLERQSLAKLQQLNYSPTDPRILDRHRWVSLALFGQKRYKESVAVFDYLDELAGDDPKIKARVRYPFDRAMAYLHNNKALEAIPLLASSSAALAKQYGISPAGRQHFFTAQSSGLQGVAHWRVGTAESKAQAYPLLKAAVQGIMAPENLDYLENVGTRKELREMIFSTYIEAAAQTNPADALAALGIADWLRGGLVQEALGDAAVRSAASNAALSDLIRQDQDASPRPERATGQNKSHRGGRRGARADSVWSVADTSQPFDRLRTNGI